MKNFQKQKFIKSSLNESLSKVVKNLQQDFTQNVTHDSTVQSDNDLAQEIIAILEGAFIHGLKSAYFEKYNRNRKELPKPQFWSLICKISHKGTIQQILKLSFIRNRVGQCRAWLRLALNDASLLSYLSSLLHIPEYKPLLGRFYDEYALFRDQEQSDIFLRYLQGIENLTFELSSNSPILNSWTKTPLELAGLIISDPKKHLLPNGNHMKKSQSFTIQLQSSGSVQSLQGSLTNSLHLPFSSSPAISIASRFSGSTTSINGYPNNEVDNMVEVPPDVGQAPPDPIDCGDPVLHRRHLAFKSHKRRKKRVADDMLSISSRCSSISSLSSLASSGIVMSSGRIDSVDARGSVPSSISSNEANSKHLTDRGHITYTNDNHRFDMNESENPDSIPSKNLVESNSSPSKTTNENQSFSALTIEERLDNEEDLQNLPDISRLKIIDQQTEEILPNDQKESEPLHHLKYDSRIDSEEYIDIYAMPSHPTSTHNSETDVDSETVLDGQNAPTSPGYGNSLLCGGGWSSDVCLDLTEKKLPVSSTPVVNPPATIDKTKQKEATDFSSNSIVYSRREGYLRKKSELLFWRERWFVLTGDTLSYYKDRNSTEKIETIHMINVNSVDDKNISKNNSICIKMVDGTEHLISSNNRNMIIDWSKDIRKAIKNVKQNPSAYSLDSVENTYDVLEAYDADKDNYMITPDNTSWFAAMKSLMTTIAQDKGLDAQNYQCADCAAPIGMIYCVPRVCAFTNLYYCSHCHTQEEHIIPARVVHNWDFKKHKVSKGSKKFLLEMWNEPCIDMERVNPLGYRHIPELKKILPLRIKLTALHPYLSTCRMIPVGKFDSLLRGHFYMFEKPHLYTVGDLCKLPNDSLYDIINKAVTFGVNHVTSCKLCTSKGFVCEICRKKEIIFAFQTEQTIQCEDCRSVYHMTCLPDLSKCPKCERRNRRLKIDLIQEEEEHE